MDYKNLLAKYIAHCNEQSGAPFVENMSTDNFTYEEIDQIISLHQNEGYRAELRRYHDNIRQSVEIEVDRDPALDSILEATTVQLVVDKFMNFIILDGKTPEEIEEIRLNGIRNLESYLRNRKTA